MGIYYFLKFFLTFFLSIGDLISIDDEIFISLTLVVINDSFKRKLVYNVFLYEFFSSNFYCEHRPFNKMLTHYWSMNCHAKFLIARFRNNSILYFYSFNHSSNELFRNSYQHYGLIPFINTLWIDAAQLSCGAALHFMRFKVMEHHSHFSQIIDAHGH